MTDDTQRPDERVDDIEDILKTVRDGAIESRDAAAITRLNTALIAYRNLRYRAERAEADGARLRKTLKQIAKHARHAPLGGDDRGSLHAIYGHARTALTAAPTGAGVADEEAGDEAAPDPA